MLLELVYRKRKRAISPVIATVLIIGLALAAATAVIAVLNATNNDNFAFEDSGPLGTDGEGSGIDAPKINITGIEPNGDLQLDGIEEYTEIRVDVTNVASNPIFVFDIDVLVYGNKLDEIAQWYINGTHEKDGSVSRVGAGYRQSTGSTIMYTVTLSEPTNQEARIPLNASFVYEVIYGSSADLISGTVQKEKLSEVIYTPIYYDVAIMHYGSSFGSNDAAAQFEDTLSTVNGTNEIIFRYSRTDDAYDYRNAPGNVVAENITSNYNLVIVDVWAVPLDISNQLWHIHQNGSTKLLFYGSISTLGNDFSSDQTSTIQSKINVSATQELLGVTPDMAGAPANIDVTDHGYSFDETSSSILAGLSGRAFEEDEDESYTGGGGNNPSVCGDDVTGSGVGDIYGYDIANFTGSSAEYINYGSSYFDFQRDTGSGLSSIDGYPKTDYGLFVERFNGSSGGNNETLALSFIWKHNNSLAPSGADLIDSTHLTQIRNNMLGAATGESSRIFTFEPKSSIDVFNVNVPNQSGKWFDLQVEGKIRNADVEGGAMSIEVNMPEYKFHDCSPDKTGEFYVDGTLEASGISVVIQSDSIISVDIGDYYSGKIEVGQTYSLELGPLNTELFKIDANGTMLDWVVSIYTGDHSAVTETFSRAVDADADQTAPDQVTGLSVDATTASNIDLSWDETSDNGGGVVDYYEINRDGTVIDTTTSTSYTDSGLSSSTSYTYKVRAVDDSGNKGLYSDEVTGTTDSGTPPPKVTGLNATAISSSQIDLSWDSITNIDDYKVYRNSSHIATISAGTTTYSDTGLSASTTYTYEVSAVNNTLEGEKSDPDSATTDPSATPIMYVDSMSVSYTQQGGGQDPQYTITVTFSVVDGDGNSLDGVTVDFDYSLNGGASDSSSGTTGGDGTVSVDLPNSDKLREGESFSATVTDLTKAGYDFDSNQGVTQLTDSDGPPDGTDATTS